MDNNNTNTTTDTAENIIETQVSKKKSNMIVTIVMGLIILALAGALAFTYLVQIPDIQKSLDELTANNATVQSNLKMEKEKIATKDSKIEAQSEQLAQMKQSNIDLATKELVNTRTIEIMSEMNQLLLEKAKLESALTKYSKNSTDPRIKSTKTKIINNMTKLKKLNEELGLVEINVMKEIENDPSLIPNYDNMDILGNNGTADLSDITNNEEETNEEETNEEETSDDLLDTITEEITDEAETDLDLLSEDNNSEENEEVDIETSGEDTQDDTDVTSNSVDEENEVSTGEENFDNIFE